MGLVRGLRIMCGIRLWMCRRRFWIESLFILWDISWVYLLVRCGNFIMKSRRHILDMLIMLGPMNNAHIAWNINCWSMHDHSCHCQDSDSPRIHAYWIISLSIEDTRSGGLNLHVEGRVALVLRASKHLKFTSLGSWYTHLDILMFGAIVCQFQVVLWTCLRSHPVKRSKSCWWVDWKNGVTLVGCEHLLHKIWNRRSDRVGSRTETV